MDNRMRGYDKTRYKKDRRDIMLVQVYVDDIIFGSTKSSMVSLTLKVFSTVHAVKRDLRRSNFRDVNILEEDWSLSNARNKQMLRYSSTKANMYSCTLLCQLEKGFDFRGNHWADLLFDDADGVDCFSKASYLGLIIELAIKT
ncbi:hypothetical protein Tco_1183260 [Tanacetum coccineum]